MIWFFSYQQRRHFCGHEDTQTFRKETRQRGRGPSGQALGASDRGGPSSSHPRGQATRATCGTARGGDLVQRVGRCGKEARACSRRPGLSSGEEQPGGLPALWGLSKGRVSTIQHGDFHFQRAFPVRRTSAAELCVSEAEAEDEPLLHSSFTEEHCRGLGSAPEEKKARCKNS